MGANTADALGVHCTGCGHGWTLLEYPPADPDGRTHREVRLAALSSITYRLVTMQEGVCPICAGTVSASLFVCKGHVVENGDPCDRCGRKLECLVPLSCDVCKHQKNAHPEDLPRGYRPCGRCSSTTGLR